MNLDVTIQNPMVLDLQQTVVNIEIIERTRSNYDIVYQNVELVQNKQIGMLLFDVPCDSSVYIGAAVVMQANGVAKNAIATNYADSNVIGIAESKTSSTLCDIRFFGATSAIFNNLDVAQEYYLSDTIPGGLVPTAQAPLTTGHIRIKLGQPFSSKEFVLAKGDRIIKG